MLWMGPPEAIAANFEAGSPASVIANNAVWVVETANHELSMGLSFANTAATQDIWQGLGSVASAVAATGLNAGLQTKAGWTAHKITVSQAAIDAFTSAQSSVIPSVVSQTNRAEREAMDKANPSVLWSFTPAIVERDLEYFGQHWPHNSTVGWTYATTLTGLTAELATPPPIAPIGASPAAPAAAGEAVSQAAATVGAQDGMSVSEQAAQAAGQTTSSASSPGEMISSLAQPAQSLLQPAMGAVQAPAQLLQGSTSSLSQGIGSLTGMFSSLKPPEAAAAEVVAEPVLAAGGGAGGAGSGFAVSAGGVGAGGFPGAGLTSYTRPTSSFEPDAAGRPVGLRAASVLNAAEVRGPLTNSIGGGGVPVSPASMLTRADSDPDKQNDVARARIVVREDESNPQ
jgi:hypothetical protein